MFVVESEILGFGIRYIHLKESVIPLTIGIRNPGSAHKESGNRYLESVIYGVECGIRNPRRFWIPLHVAIPQLLLKLHFDSTISLA